jgi:hypothetical protein
MTIAKMKESDVRRLGPARKLKSAVRPLSPSCKRAPASTEVRLNACLAGVEGEASSPVLSSPPRRA